MWTVGAGRMHGIAVGSWQDCSTEVDALAGEAADAMAARHWRLMGSRTQADARGGFMQHVQRRWSAAFWRSWRAMLHARLHRASAQRAAACCARTRWRRTRRRSRGRRGAAPRSRRRTLGWTAAAPRAAARERRPWA